MVKLNAAPGAPETRWRAGKTFDRSAVWVSHRPVVVDATGRISSEEGGGVKMPKKITSGSRLDAREVEVVAVALKPSKGPPPDRI